MSDQANLPRGTVRISVEVVRPSVDEAWQALLKKCLPIIREVKRTAELEKALQAKAAQDITAALESLRALRSQKTGRLSLLVKALRAMATAIESCQEYLAFKLRTRQPTPESNARVTEAWVALKDLATAAAADLKAAYQAIGEADLSQAN